MYGLLAEILHYAQNATRFKWWSIVFAWIVCLGGWTYVSFMPDVFTATARVHVDTRSILRPLLQGMTIQPDISAQIRLMARLIFSRPNVEKIARMTDLDLGAKDEKSMEKLVLRLQNAMTITGGENNLFTIGVTDPDPKTAKKIVQAVLTLFVEQTLGESREDSGSASKFLDQQIKEYEQRLVAAEQQREEFKRANYGLISDTGENKVDLYGQLNKLEMQREEARLLIQEAMQRRDELQRQLQNEEPMIQGSEANSGGMDPMDARIHNLQSKLDETLLRYTPKHPSAVALKKSIAELEKQKNKEAMAFADNSEKGMVGKGQEPNPIYQQLKIALSEADANVASLNARQKSFDEKIELLKQQMDERLKIETQLAGLNRDYETVKANYNQLLSRRETARMSETVEQTTEAVKFKIVDPPQVPSKPSAPNRILISSGVLIASLVLGISLAVLISLLRPSFGTLQGLRDVTGLSVLGTVSMNWIPEHRRKKGREIRNFLGILVALIIVYLGMVMLEIKGINLHHLVG